MSAPSAPTPDDAPREHAQPAPSTAITRLEPLDARIRYARTIAAAGTLLPRGLRDGINPNNADDLAGRVFLIAETGNMLGIHPVAALQGVNIIEGTPSISPALMTALVRRAGHKVRTRVEGTVAEGNVKAVCQVIRSDDPEWPFTSEWTLERAERAGLITVKRDERTGRTSVNARSKSGKILPWEAYTEAMLKARAIGEACREAAEDALMGVHYVNEEIGGHVNEAGEIVGEVVEDAPAATPAQPHAAPPRSAEQPPAAPEGQPSGPEAAQDDDAALLAHVYAQACKAQNAQDLTDAWAEGAAMFKRAGLADDELPAFGDWAAARTVDVKGRTVTLRDLFHELGEAAKAAHEAAVERAAREAAQPQAEPTDEERGVYADGSAEDVVDAEVVEDAVPDAPGTEYGIPGRGGYTVRDGVDPEDPWAEPEPGVAAVAAGLGGEVIDVEGEGVTANEVRHARAQADAARQAPKQPRNTPPKKSAGRAAVAAAREEIAQRQREALGKEVRDVPGMREDWAGK